MPISLPRSLQWEDAFLFAWFGIVEPLLYKLFGRLLGDVQPWDIGSHPNLALGLMFLLASLGGLIVVATRAPGQSQSDLDSGSVASFARLPMLVTLTYFLLYSFSAFGADLPLFLPCGLFAFFILVSMLFNRLPVVPILARRALITPLIILGTWNFSTLMHTFFQGFDLDTLLHTPALRDPKSSFTFVLGLVFASAIFFYLVFILAPRQIAYPGGSWRDWLARFALYMLGILLNLGWIPIL